MMRGARMLPPNGNTKTANAERWAIIPQVRSSCVGDAPETGAAAGFDSFMVSPVSQALPAHRRSGATLAALPVRRMRRTLYRRPCLLTVDPIMTFRGRKYDEL